MDMSEHVAPKSDQLDAEDLRGGPVDVTVASVRKGPSADQPINFYLEEIDRPWRPTKIVRRLIMGIWGKDTETYSGKRLRLYRDPKVTFGGMAVGGIRVSHMSHLPNSGDVCVVNVMVGRGKYEDFPVERLPDVAPQGGATSEKPEPLGDHTRKHVFALLGELGVDDVEEQKARMSKVLRRKIKSRSELTEADGQRLITAMKKALDARPAPEPENEPDPNFPPEEG